MDPERQAQLVREHGERLREFQERQAQRLEAQQKKLRHELWNASGVPRIHREWADDFAHGKIELHDVARDTWLAAFNHLRDRISAVSVDGSIKLSRATMMQAAMVGDRGCGKTQLAVSLIRHGCGLLCTSFYTTAIDMFAHLRTAYGTSEQSEEQVLARYKTPVFLVIDESHRRSGSDFEYRKFEDVLDYRYHDGRPTLILSNETPEAFAESIGPSIHSRIEETEDVIVCDGWPNFRELAREGGRH